VATSSVAGSRFGAGAVCVAALAAGVGCSEVGTAPDLVASIEFVPLANRAVALGDSLRDTAGTAVPLQAIVRNVQGDALTDAPVRYLYVQFARDSALEVDSITGHVVARRLPGSGPVQVAARSGDALQILRDLRVANAPDTAFATDPAAALALTFPDTGSTAAQRNSAEVRVQVQATVEGTRQGVGDWLVRFTVVEPANPTNDTTAQAWLLDDSFRPSVLDTTGSGIASRRVRVRLGSGTLPDTVVVEASVRVRGEPVAGSPVRVRVPVTPPPLESRAGPP
jgi:hypothetical protein